MPPHILDEALRTTHAHSHGACTLSPEERKADGSVLLGALLSTGALRRSNGDQSVIVESVQLQALLWAAWRLELQGKGCRALSNLLDCSLRMQKTSRELLRRVSLLTLGALTAQGDVDTHDVAVHDPPPTSHLLCLCTPSRAAAEALGHVWPRALAHHDPRAAPEEAAASPRPPVRRLAIAPFGDHTERPHAAARIRLVWHPAHSTLFLPACRAHHSEVERLLKAEEDGTGPVTLILQSSVTQQGGAIYTLQLGGVVGAQQGRRVVEQPQNSFNASTSTGDGHVPPYGLLDAAGERLQPIRTSTSWLLHHGKEAPAEPGNFSFSFIGATGFGAPGDGPTWDEVRRRLPEFDVLSPKQREEELAVLDAEVFRKHPSLSTFFSEVRLGTA